MPPDRLPRQAYIMLCNLNNLGRHTWATSIKNILFSYGFGYAWIAQEIGNKDIFLSCFETRSLDILKQQWKANITGKPKLRTYKEFKSLLEPEKYLSFNCNWKFIQTFACFRCASLPLAIEEGRRHNIDSLSRFCNICKRVMSKTNIIFF